MSQTIHITQTDAAPIAKVAFPKQAGGSLVVEEGAVVGSERIGRSWDRPEYFWGRPSATQGASGALPYNGAASGGDEKSGG